MCAEALTQEEIDALLRSHAGAMEEESPELASEEKEALSQYLEIFQKAYSDVWSMLAGQDFGIALDKIESMSSEDLPEKCPEELVCASAEHLNDVQGDLMTVLPKDLAMSIAGSMTGTSEFGELEQSAMEEGLGQTFGTLCTQISGNLKIATQVSSPKIMIYSQSDDDFLESIKNMGTRVVCAFLTITFGDQSGPFLFVFSNNVIDGLMKATVRQDSPPSVEMGPAPSSAPSSGSAPVSGPMVQKANFQPLEDTYVPGKPGNLDLILDIGLDVRVELGRTNMKIRDVLELGPGSVIELDKLAGELVDLLVNDKLFARGEVVVIDENFGVRVTDIMSIEQRIQSLGER